MDNPANKSRLNIKQQLLKIAIGLINSLAISVVNFLYFNFAIHSVSVENHKYPDTYQ